MLDLPEQELRRVIGIGLRAGKLSYFVLCVDTQKVQKVMSSSVHHSICAPFAESEVSDHGAGEGRCGVMTGSLLYLGENYRTEELYIHQYIGLA